MRLPPSLRLHEQRTRAALTSQVQVLRFPPDGGETLDLTDETTKP